MKQKFENLGLILSRESQKKLVGGDDPTESFGNGDCLGNYPNGRFCSSSSECSFWCGGNILSGQCVSMFCQHP